MTDLATTIDTYLSMLNEPDAAVRAGLIEQTWAPGGRWIDPPAAAEGHDGINGMVGAVQELFPDHTFRRASGIDEHHDHLRFAWELVAPDGTVALTGVDVGELAIDGRIARITGFIGDLPALTPA